MATSNVTTKMNVGAKLITRKLAVMMRLQISSKQKIPCAINRTTNGRESVDAGGNLVSFMRSPGLDREYAMLLLVQLKTNRSVMKNLKALPAFRDLAGELVGLHAGMDA